MQHDVLSPPPEAGAPRRYNTLAPEVEARVEALLAQMTPAEKVGQLHQVSPDPPPAPGEGVPAERPGLEGDLRAGRVGSLLNLMDPARANRYQRLAVEGSRLGIPLLIGADVVHGHRTVFPIPLAESCTWNPELLEQAARVAAGEASAVGVNWIFAPMVDVARDPRWGRVAEGGGEDPYLTGVLGAARVRGFQTPDPEGGRVAACPKHYVAYGAAEAGRDYNTVDVSERSLREVYLPPFRAAFEAGAGSVMSAFNEIGGVPATVNSLTLRTVLRDEWGWPGVVLSDYDAVQELIPHGVASDLRDAARQSLEAGLDVDMVSGAYAAHLEDLVGAGELNGAHLDEAVRRVLRLKFRLGLFERPNVDEALAERAMLRPEARDLAREVARQSVVLLKNDADVLPLTPGAGRVAVIGPLADAPRAQLGCWVLAGRPEDAVTVLQGLRAYAPDLAQVSGCAVRGDEAPDLAGAVAAARAADVVVLVLGEDHDMSGEARSRAHLGLPGHQEALADAVIATGTPVVCVLLSGRPLVVPELARRCAALLAAWHGGTEAGGAVADLLYGAANPCGRLTAGWPRAEGQLPMSYAHKNTGRPKEGAGAWQFGEPYASSYTDVPNAPLFPFGFGLSYTRFEYRSLVVLTPTVVLGGTLAVEVQVKNTGSRDGAEVVQLYVRDLVGSVTRPVRELKAFDRVTLLAGETRTVRLEVPVERLAFVRQDGRLDVEPGDFEVWVGPNSTEGLKDRFTL